MVKNIYIIFFLLISVFLFSSCMSDSFKENSSLAFSEIPVTGLKTIHLLSGDKILDISKDYTASGFTSWWCDDFSHAGKILVEVGFFTFRDSDTVHGFILYDGTTEGEVAIYSRQGLEHRWDWGTEGQYSFVINPNGNGLYYDFTGVPEGEGVKPKSIYKAHKRNKNY